MKRKCSTYTVIQSKSGIIQGVWNYATTKGDDKALAEARNKFASLVITLSDGAFRDAIGQDDDEYSDTLGNRVEMVMGDLYDVSEDVDSTEQEKPTQYKYFVFGEEAARMYYDGSLRDVIDMLKRDGTIFRIESVDGRVDKDVFLEAYDGWMGCADITQREYEIIASAIGHKE